MSLNLDIMDFPENPLRVTLGANKSSTIPRRIVRVEIQLDGFELYRTSCFILPIPNECDLLLGIPWLQDMNLDIDWAKCVVNYRDRQLKMDRIAMEDICITSSDIVPAKLNMANAEAKDYILHINHLYYLAVENSCSLGFTTKAIKMEDLFELR